MHVISDIASPLSANVIVIFLKFHLNNSLRGGFGCFKFPLSTLLHCKINVCIAHQIVTIFTQKGIFWCEHYDTSVYSSYTTINNDLSGL